MRLTLDILATLVLCACLAGIASAQGLSILFSTDGTETANNNAAGNATSPGNYAAVFRDEAVLAYSPASSNFAHAIANRSTWASWFGDDDGDLNYIEGVAGNLDAVHLSANAPNPPSIFDTWVSFSNDAGPGGVLGTAATLDGDVFRINRGGGVTSFITEAQFKAAINTTADIDVNGFTVDEATGDLYFTMTTTQTVNGIAVNDGALIQIPASAYVANADGTVQSVTTGGAQIALFELHLDFFYGAAGLGMVGDLDGIAIDPAGGTFVGPSGGTFPHFWFVADNGAGPAIVSSQSGGTVASSGGNTFNDGNSVGISNTDFQGGANSTLTALAVAPFDITTRARTLETGTPALLTPGMIKIDGAGFTPGANLLIVAQLTNVSAPSGFAPRLSLNNSVLDVPGGFGELYITNFMDPLVNLTINAAPATVGGSGYGSATWPVPMAMPGIGIIAQAYDVAAGAASNPVTIVTQ